MSILHLENGGGVCPWVGEVEDMKKHPRQTISLECRCKEFAIANLEKEVCVAPRDRRGRSVLPPRGPIRRRGRVGRWLC